MLSIRRPVDSEHNRETTLIRARSSQRSIILGEKSGRPADQARRSYSIRSDLLFESHTNAISLPPNDITKKWSIVSLEEDAKAFGDILRVTVDSVFVFKNTLQCLQAFNRRGSVRSLSSASIRTIVLRATVRSPATEISFSIQKGSTAPALMRCMGGAPCPIETMGQAAK